MDRFETIFKKKIQPFIENVKADFIRAKIILLFSCILFALSFFSLSIPYVMVYIFPLQMISLLRFLLILAIPGMVYGINTMRKIDKKFKKTIMPEFATFIQLPQNHKIL